MHKYTNILRLQSRAIELCFALIALAGILAFLVLPSNVYPELTFPRIIIIAQSGDMAPDRVVLAVARPLEEAAGRVYNVRWIRSKTIRGSTELSVEFQPNTDMQLALQQVQARLNEVTASLPPNTSLTVERVTPAIFPVITYNIWSPTLASADLRTICQYQVQPRLTKVTGVARVELQGGDVRQLAVKIDPIKLQFYKIGLADVVTAIQKTNVATVVGKVDEAYQQNLIVASGESLTPEQLQQIVVVNKTDAPVLLRDIGDVQWGIADRTKIVSVNGRPGINLSIFRQPNSNVVSVSDLVAKEIEALRSSLPPGVIFQRSYDESLLVVDAINNVRDAILIGITMIVVVLFLFLREWRSTLIASLSIPLSACAAFGIMYLMGQSLNLMSLGGIAVAIGLVIDDAVVVVENIDHQLRLGLDTFEAVAQALRELFVPVVSSTVTTVVVFLPLGLLSGVAGQFFISFTWTLAIAVVFSLILSLTLTPMLAARWLPRRATREERRANPTYQRILETVLRRRSMSVALAALLMAVAIFLGTKLGSDFLPAMDEGSYIIDYAAPPGTSLSQTNIIASRLENILAKDPDVTSWTRRTGAESGLFATQINTGDIQVVLKPKESRSRTIWQIFDEQRKQAEQVAPEADIDFHQILQDQLNDLSGVSSPIEVRVFGSDGVVLRSITAKIEEIAGKIAGLVDIVVTGRVGSPETTVRVNPVVAAKLGLTATDVASQMQDAMLGGIATQVRQGDRLVDVRVSLADVSRNDPNELNSIPIVGTTGHILPLAAVAKVETTTGEGTITRENQQRYDAVHAGVEGRDLGSTVAAISNKVASIKLPTGYFINIGGLASAQKDAFLQMLAILALGIILVYFVLLIQFRSWKQPFAIILAIPPALFGVVVALTITATPWNVSSMMGVILLVGLVVKNGIILLDYTNRLRVDENYSVENALETAGSLRLRPITMTTLCTVLGLFPLALGVGAGSELQKPLAIAVIGGLSLSTIFTLIFMPVIYSLLELPGVREAE